MLSLVILSCTLVSGCQIGKNSEPPLFTDMNVVPVTTEEDNDTNTNKLPTKEEDAKTEVKEGAPSVTME